MRTTSACSAAEEARGGGEESAELVRIERQLARLVEGAHGAGTGAARMRRDGPAMGKDPSPPQLRGRVRGDVAVDLGEAVGAERGREVVGDAARDAAAILLGVADVELEVHALGVQRVEAVIRAPGEDEPQGHRLGLERVARVAREVRRDGRRPLRRRPSAARRERHRRHGLLLAVGERTLARRRPRRAVFGGPGTLGGLGRSRGESRAHRRARASRAGSHPF